MKIGILTFHFVANYGAYLQAYSLVKAIKQLGHQVEIINYRNKIHYDGTRFKPWVYRRPMRLWFDLRKHQAFKRVTAKMPFSPSAADPSQVDWNGYDAIVIGSDIVWNCEVPTFGQDPVFFGRFPVSYRGKLVAYAPSIGPMKWNYAAPLWVAQGLRQFHFVGVRDIETQKFVRNQTGQEVPLVADPTWLTEPDTTAISNFQRRTAKDFLLIYSFPLKGLKAENARAFAQAHRLSTVAAGYYQPWADRNWGDVDPFEWIQLFRQAKYVICGTFHGTLYCIKNRARFCVFSHPSVDPKVIVPLTVTELQDRHISNPEAINTILEKPIDYDRVDSKRTEYVQQSLEFLKKALS